MRFEVVVCFVLFGLSMWQRNFLAAVGWSVAMWAYLLVSKYEEASPRSGWPHAR